MRSLRRMLGLAVSALALAAPSSAMAAPKPGDILVASDGDASRGTIVAVDPYSGTRTLVSDFADGAQGPLGDDLSDIAREASGTVLVTDTAAGTSGRGALFRVNPATGARALLSDFGNAQQGPLGRSPVCVVADRDGTIFVGDLRGGGHESGFVYRIDPATGARTSLVDFRFSGDVAGDLEIDAEGRLVMLTRDREVAFEEGGSLFRVDKNTGSKTALGAFYLQNGPAEHPRSPQGLARGTNGKLMLIDPRGGAGAGTARAEGALWSIDSADGAFAKVSFSTGDGNDGPPNPFDVTVGGGDAIALSPGELHHVDLAAGTWRQISDLDDASQGPVVHGAKGVVATPLVASRNILVLDPFWVDSRGFATGALFSVDPATGARRIVTEFGNPVQGVVSKAKAAARDSAGRILVTLHSERPGLARVDPVTGERFMVSTCSAAQGTACERPDAIAPGPAGTVWMTDDDGGSGTHGALFRVDTTTGARVRETNLGNAQQGPLGFDAPTLGPPGVAGGTNGSVFLLDQRSAAAGLGGRLFRVDPSDGSRTILSDFNDASQGPGGQDVLSVAFSPPLFSRGTGRLLVTDRSHLYGVDPSTGARRLIATFEIPSWPYTQELYGVAIRPAVNVYSSETVFVVTGDGGTNRAGTLERVDPGNGARVVVSDFGNASQGPIGRHPQNLALVP